MWIIVGLAFAHFLADFVFQTRDMAMNKSSSLAWLTAHVVEYTFVFGVAAFVVLWVVGGQWCGEAIFMFIVGNGVAHWCIDSMTSRFNSYCWVSEKFSWFWAGIGFDQWLHAVVMVLLWCRYFG
ncbi:MAG: DUF3307 domain-containing protein [Candidatus Thorarchaeota archaeon]